MNRVQMCVESLVDAILQSEIYQHYQECEEKIQQDPQLRDRVDAYRSAVYRMNNECGPEELQEQMKRLDEEFSDFRKSALVNEYLEAELDVVRQLQRVNQRIHEGIPIRIPQM